ncbi:MAG TPA: universal stress protein [Acidimicrobiales bacterium]
MKRIVVGVDGSAGSQQALAFALEEACLHGATVVAVHAWQPPIVYGSGFSPVPVLPADGAYEEAAKTLLADAVSTVLKGHPGQAVDQIVLEGAAGEVLLDMAADADLLVVGSRGHGTFVGMLLGSVSQHCVHKAQCPVVVVPSPEA